MDLKYWNAAHLGRRLLKKRAYIGEFSDPDVKQYFPELAIVDKATFDLAQVRMSRNRDIRPEKTQV